MKCLEFVYSGAASLCRPMNPDCGPQPATRTLKLIFKEFAVCLEKSCFADFR